MLPLPIMFLQPLQRLFLVQTRMREIIRAYSEIQTGPTDDIET